MNKILGFNPHIIIKPYEKKINKQNLNELNKLKKEISRTAFTFTGQGILINKENTTGVLVRSYQKDEIHNIKLIKEGITFQNHHFMVEIPFNDAIRDLPWYRREVKQAMTRFEAKLVKNESHLSSYNSQISQLLDSGVFEVVEDEVDKNKGSFIM